MLQSQGQSQRAAEHFRESLKIYHALGVRNAVAYCLEMLAGLDADGDRHREAASLFGAVDKLREILDAPVESFNRERYQGDLKRVRENLGEAEFEAVWNEGRDMRLEEAVEAAQQDLS